MKLKLSELNHNPYKKQINKGKLNEDQIENISKNLDELGLMGSIPIVKRDKKYFIVNCHHRIEALKRKFGKDFQVEVTLHDYDDSQLLQGMVIENLTQRNNDFREELENVNAVKHFLEKSGVRSSDTCDSLGRTKHQDESQGIGARQISDFLNDTLSKSKVAELLRIHKNIPNEIILESTNKQGEFKEGQLRYDQLVSLSKIEDKYEVNDLANALKKSYNQRVLDHRGFIKFYIDAQQEIKDNVRNGKLDIADIESAVIGEEIKDFNDKNPRFEFIPNFAGRLRQFNKDIYQLEKQVFAFKAVFRSDKFKEKYATLKPQQKKSLSDLIINIRSRIKNCYDEVEFFISIIPEKDLLEDKKK